MQDVQNWNLWRVLQKIWWDRERVYFDCNFTEINLRIHLYNLAKRVFAIINIDGRAILWEFKYFCSAPRITGIDFTKLE